MYAKVCKNDDSYFWTIWEDFNPTNKEHLEFNDVYLIEANSIKWRIIEDKEFEYWVVRKVVYG